ncbi:MAG: P-loop NTPase [Candidatus Aenigmatarchaeota archaeon]
MRKKTAIVSGKGGVGKTVTTLNIAASLHDIDENVLVVDGDLSNPTIGLYLGLYQFPNTFNQVLESNASPHEALYIHQTGLRIIPASISLNNLETDVSDMGKVFEQLDGHTLIDCPPGFGREVQSIIRNCDEVVAVTNPISPAVIGCMRLVEMARNMGKPVKGIVLNNLTYQEVDSEEIEAICNAPILGEVPRDSNVDYSIEKRMPLVKDSPYAPASLSFKEIAHKLIDKEYSKPLFPSFQRFVDKISKL